MFCPNCGNQVNEHEKYCGQCGCSIQSLKTNSEKPILKKINQIKEQLIQHKKITFSILGSCFIIMLAFILFSIFYDGTKLKWNPENPNTEITYTEAKQITLDVIAFDKNKKPIETITFQTKDGKIEANGTKVVWTLPEKEGNYTITATSPSGKTIKKEIQVIKLKEAETKALAGLNLQEDKEDSDEDGLTDEEERKLGTNPYLKDTDRDGISDYHEINHTKTDPLKADTDEDGILDGCELDLGLDPLQKDSKNDGIIDSEREITYALDDKYGVTMNLTGNGNITTTTIDVFENSAFDKLDGVLNKIYNFHTKGKLKNATVTIKYDIEELKEKNINEEQLSIFYFDEETKELEIIPTKIEKNKKELTATIDHFSKYVIGDKTKLSTKQETEILFVIDNSVSMYNEQQLTDAGYTDIQGAVGNDTTFKRLSLTNRLIDLFTGNYDFGVSEFSGSYKNLQDFTKEKGKLKQVVNSMQAKFQTSIKGTNIVKALKGGIQEFSSKKAHYMILLTDGKDTSDSMGYNKQSIIESANKNDIKICVIGLGNNLDTQELSEIAKKTGCNYYNASNASALDEIYATIGSHLNYNYVDTNQDNKTDAMIYADSKFLVNRDGFSFSNFISNKSEYGHCYGMATFAMLYYQNQLPEKLPSAHKHTIFKNFAPSDGYDLTNTYFTTGQNLYDFHFTDEGLKLLLEESPSDYRDRIEENTLMIKKDYYEALSKIGNTFSIKDYKKNDKDFTKYQSALLNIDNDLLKNNVSKDESQLLSAIYRLFILQVDGDRTTFLAEPDKAFQELVEKLTNGVPQVIGVNNSHAINAIKLIQDAKDANRFKIEVYDNNYPGETRYIEAERSKFSKWQLNFTAWTNEYEYTFKYDTNNDGISEELDVMLLYPKIE